MSLLNHLEQTHVEKWNEFRSADIRETPNDELLRSIQVRILHAQQKSNLLHSMADYLQKNKEDYSKNNGFEFQILRSSLLHASYALREALFNLVNEVWELEVDNEEYQWQSSVREEVDNSNVDSVLGSLMAGTVQEFLSKYRDPETHDNTLVDLGGEDIAASLAGNPRPYIEEFIEDCKELSEKFEEKEKTIIEEAMNELNY